MASNLREENVNGYKIAVCENSRSKTFYLYEGFLTTKSDGQEHHIYTWQPNKPGQQDRDLAPCLMPSGFELFEWENHQPALKKR